MTQTATTYTAWLRLHPGRWQRIATGTAAEVTARPQEEAARHQHCDLLILPANRDANERLRRTVRR